MVHWPRYARFAASLAQASGHRKKLKEAKPLPAKQAEGLLEGDSSTTPWLAALQPAQACAIAPHAEHRSSGMGAALCHISETGGSGEAADAAPAAGGPSAPLGQESLAQPCVMATVPPALRLRSNPFPQGRAAPGAHTHVRFTARWTDRLSSLSPGPPAAATTAGVIAHAQALGVAEELERGVLADRQWTGPRGEGARLTADPRVPLREWRLTRLTASTPQLARVRPSGSHISLRLSLRPPDELEHLRSGEADKRRGRETNDIRGTRSEPARERELACSERAAHQARRA